MYSLGLYAPELEADAPLTIILEDNQNFEIISIIGIVVGELVVHSQSHFVWLYPETLK
jgi:hypothetical protein